MRSLEVGLQIAHPCANPSANPCGAGAHQALDGLSRTHEDAARDGRAVHHLGKTHSMGLVLFFRFLFL